MKLSRVLFLAPLALASDTVSALFRQVMQDVSLS